MNTEAFLVLLIPLFGLFAILRGGRWNWDPIGTGGSAWTHTPFMHRLLAAMLWFGWTTSLAVGVLMLLDILPAS